MKIGPVGAELFHADRQTDGQTDMTKLIVTSRYFAKAPKNGHVWRSHSKDFLHNSVFSSGSACNKLLQMQYSLNLVEKEHGIKRVMKKKILVSFINKKSTAHISSKIRTRNALKY